MSRDEVKKILMIIDATYPNFRCDNLSDIIDAWHFMLSDIEYNRIAIALKTFVNTSGSAFAPSVAELIAIVHKPAESKYLNANEAWALVYRAITKSTYNSEDEFNKLPELVQKAIGSANQLRAWATDSEFNAGVESSNFKRVYNTTIERDKEYQRMPVEMRTLIQQQTNLLLEG